MNSFERPSSRPDRRNLSPTESISSWREHSEANSMAKAKRKPTLTLVVDGGVVVNEVTTILANPKQTTKELTEMTYDLGNRSGAVKNAIRDVKPTLDTEQERLRVYGSQQPPGWASVRIAQLAMTTVST